MAGGRNDELGALGANLTIVAGRSGHELIVGGPGGKIVVGGAGHDLVLEPKPRATIILESPGDTVIDSGRNDRVECVGTWRNEKIYAGSTDTVDGSCRGHGDQVLPMGSQPHSLKAPRTTQAAAVSGSGSNADPFVVPCSSSFAECTATFDARLNGPWANEYVPAYRCPVTHPYLVTRPENDVGIQVPYGVEVELNGVGISITATNGYNSGHSAGTATGFPNSSATNWNFGSGKHTVILHCTSLPPLNTLR